MRPTMTIEMIHEKTGINRDYISKISRHLGIRCDPRVSYNHCPEPHRLSKEEVERREEIIRREFPTKSVMEISREFHIPSKFIGSCVKKYELKHDEATTRRLRRRVKSKEQIEKAVNTLKHVIRMERFRIESGMEQKTGINLSIIPYKTRRMIYMLKYRYKYFYDNANDRILYYDKETKRTKNEAHFIKKYHIAFEPASDYEQENEEKQ